jgi:pimeloyl-ACP methyl ester carboxylesterase
MSADETQPWADITYSSRDGLTLYGRRYPARAPGHRPLLCLPGLTRNGRDFHDLAIVLSQHPATPRDVYCIDYRGRGRSDYDPDWRNYMPYVELLDALDFMTVQELHRAAVLGTSRGGIITMLMAAIRPMNIAVAILNDIGPEMETTGLARIMGYVGRTPLPGTWEDAVRLSRQINGQFFPNLDEDDWHALARQWFDERDGRPAIAYDPKLAKAIGQIDLSRKVPDMWPQFMALAEIPTLAIRGENSDLLSQETLEAMAKRHPRLRTMTVEAQGHAPLLRGRKTIAALADFLAATDPGADA